MALIWLFCGLRNNEFKGLRCGCIRYLPEDTLVNGTSQSISTRRVCWLDVPTNKTGSSFTKPVDPAVGEAIQTSEKVRPAQPPSIDYKTGEVVHFLLFYRGHKIGDSYLNDFLIPLLCHKAGIPETDAQGAITSHRARATITTQLYNAREPMTIWELKQWLGHRYLSSTEYYLKTSPTKLAKAYQDAGYFERNRRMIDLLIDQEAVREGLVASDQLWKFYDLGHGYCDDFFDKCPHRMACANCDFYIPKESARAQMIEGKINLLRLKQEIPLTDEEMAAVDDGILLMEKLCEKLVDVPTPIRANAA
jgi:Phage integrase family